VPLQFVRGQERFSIEQEIESGLPGASQAFDHVTVAITRGGRTKRTRYNTLDAAARRYHEAIVEQLEDGFVLEVDGASTASAPASFTPRSELEQLVDDQPDDTNSWSVLADAWCEVGDPRGTCIQLERSLVGHADVDEYLRRKAQVETSRRIRYAHVWGVLGREAYRVRAVFRHGLVERFSLVDELGAPGKSTNELLGIALQGPFARFLRGLEVWSGSQAEAARSIAAHPRSERIALVARTQR
jgi:hypothetical protein